MLRQVSLENFKAFEKVSIDLGLITVLIGPNGTGKSSIAQSLMLLKQSKGQIELRLNGPYLSLGDYQDVVHKKGAGHMELGEPPGDLAIELVTNVDEQVPKWRGSSSARVVYGVRFGEVGRLKRQEASICHDQDILLKISRGQADESWAVASGPKPIFEPEQTLTLDINQPNVVYPDFSNHLMTGGERRVTYAATLIRILASKVRSVARVFLVPSIRGFDKPYYPLAQEPTEDFLLGGPSVQASQIATTFLFRRDLEDQISTWFEDIVGLRLRARLVPGGNVAIETVVVPHLNLINEGFGSNQLVHLLLQLAIAGPDSLIAIEEPEIHLHPKAQAEVANVLVRVAKTQRKQILVTTHSLDLVSSLLNNIAEGKLEPDDFLLYSCKKERGVALAERLPVDKEGITEIGLTAFYEASQLEVERYLKALSRA